MAKALLKKDLGKLKAGTHLHFMNGVFVHKEHSFLPEDIYFDEVHFEVIEEETIFDDILAPSSHRAITAL
jgi:hypothetical protein